MIRIGYPCMNTSVGCTTAGTLRLANYSDEKVEEKIRANLSCLKKIFEYNLEHDIQLYRVSSNLIPFASHPIMTFDWKSVFKDEFSELGRMAKEGGMRLSTHPGQFVLINSPKDDVVAASIKELSYQADVLELLGTDISSKVQIHVGGVYGDKETSIARFVERYESLPKNSKDRLVIENDERMYTIEDCMEIHSRTGVPVLFDNFHHSIYPGTFSVREAFTASCSTWKDSDGIQQMDFSQQDPEKQLGAHSQSIEPSAVIAFLTEAGNPSDLDIMLEVKDKEMSVQKVRADIQKTF